MQQTLILILVALLGITALVLLGIALFSPPPAAANPTAQPVTQATVPGSLSSPAPQALTTATLIQIPAGCAQGKTSYSQGSVVQVIDSQTLAVQSGETTLRVSYAGIDVPAKGTAADAAVQKARDLLEGRQVLLVKDTSEQDAAGRLVRYVFSGETLVNAELVRQGLASVQPGSPDQSCVAVFQQAEQQARAQRLGIWKPTPVPTATFIPFVTLDPSHDAPCDCLARPTCEEFSTHAKAQACYNACNDYNSKLDDNRDGIACPDLP